MEECRDPVKMQVPRARRSGTHTKPRDVLADPFLKELLRVVQCNRKTQVSVNTPKERAVAEVLFSLAKMHRSSDGALNSPPPDDHDSTDHSPAIVPQEPPYGSSMNTSSARVKPSTRKSRGARNPQPYYGSESDCMDSESELWKESSRMDAYRHANSNAHPLGKDMELQRGNTRVRGNRRPRQSFDAFRDPIGDANAATSSQRMGELFGDRSISIPRSKRSRINVRKPIPNGSVWSGSSEGRDEGRVSRSSHTATEGKSCQEHGPSLEDYGAGPTTDKEAVEQEGPVPASLKRSYRRNSAHSYIAQFIRWHKQQSKETSETDWKQGLCNGSASASLPNRGDIHAPPGQGIDGTHVCSSVSAVNTPKQSIPVVWPTYLPNSRPELVKSKANGSIAGSLMPPSQYSPVLPASMPSYMQMPYLSDGLTSANSGGRLHRNTSVPYGPFSPFPSPLGAVQLQGNQVLPTGNGDVKSVSGRGIVMVSGQNMSDGYRP